MRRHVGLVCWYNLSYTLTMKTAISIPDSVFDAAEEASKRLGVSRSRLYAMAVERLVKQERSSGVREALDAVYAKTRSRLDPILAALQSATLAGQDEDW